MARSLGKPMGEVLQRVADALGAKDLAGIAEALGVPEARVRNWHQRDKVPTDAVLQVSKRTGKSVEWLAGVHSEDAGSPSFFSQNDLQVSQQAMSPAARKSDDPRAPPARVDVDLLGAVLEAVLNALASRGLKLSPPRLAELVTLIYEYEESLRVASPSAEGADIEGTTRRFLRLVA